MAVSQDFLEYCLEQLEPLGELESKRMFGGVGIYHQGCFFGLLSQDSLYLKVDQSNLADFQAFESHPFQPFPDKKGTMSYWLVPAEILESKPTLALWAEKAFQVALRTKQLQKKKKGKGGATSR